MADAWNGAWGDSWATSWGGAAPPAPTEVSSLSLVNVPSLSSGTGLGTEELDAVYVGKGKRP